MSLASRIKARLKFLMPDRPEPPKPPPDWIAPKGPLRRPDLLASPIHPDFLQDIDPMWPVAKELLDQNAVPETGYTRKLHPHTAFGRTGLGMLELPQSVTGKLRTYVKAQDQGRLWTAAARLAAIYSQTKADENHGRNTDNEGRYLPRQISSVQFTPLEKAAYTASFTPKVYTSAYTVIAELARRLPQTEFRPKRILELGPGPGTATLAWQQVHSHDLERANEYTIVTQLTGETTTLLGHQDGHDIKICKELPSSMDREGNNFDVVISTHGLSDIAATARAERLAQDSLVRDLWERVSPHGGVLIILEPGTPKGFDLIGRARDVVLRTVRNEIVLDEDPKKTAMRKNLEMMFQRILEREPGNEGEGQEHTELQLLLEDDPREARMEKLAAELVEEPPNEGIMGLEDMTEEIRDLNESEHTFDIVRRIEKLSHTPIRLFKALRIVIKEELKYSIEMMEARTQPPLEKSKPGKVKKRTRAEMEEMDAEEREQSERLEKLRKLEDYVQIKIKEKKDDEQGRNARLERENAPGVTPEGDTFFSASHDIPHDPHHVLTDQDLKLPPPLTPSAVPLPTFPIDTLALIPAPPQHAHVIAPCPHDGECPMYTAVPRDRQLLKFTPREQRQDRERMKVFNRRMERQQSLDREKAGIQGAGERKWWCHFSQKLQDPQVFALHGDREGDDGTELAKFSYVVIRKGVERPKESVYCMRTEENPDIREELILYGREKEFAAYAWPRIIAPPIKNPKHVIIDVCSPLSVREPREPSLERLVITKAQGKQVYYDARKIRWGDLWSFGSRKAGVKREVVFRQNMNRRGNMGMRRKGDVEEQIEQRDEDVLFDDTETNAWVKRRVSRLEKVQKKEERMEAKRALKVARGELR